MNFYVKYGISGNCIHLHIPGDFHQMLKEKGSSFTTSMINLYMLDALNKINNLKNNGFYKFQNIDNIYMISPIFLSPTFSKEKELKFLENFDFTTHSYTKEDLENADFLQNSSEARLGKSIFGSQKNIGTAIISLDTINTPQWQEKCNSKIKEFSQKGISLEQEIQKQ